MNSEAPPKKILIVDDQPGNIHILIENLEAEYEVLFATTGEKALDMLFSGNRPDLILLDIIMPGMNGYEVCASLKSNSETSDIPVIFVTAQGQETDETTGFRLGAADYIVKPFRMPVVKARIKAVLRLKDEMNSRKILAEKLENLNRHLEERIKEKTGELERAYESLKISENKFRTIFENAIEGIFQTTPDGRILSVSPSLVTILGYRSSRDLVAKIKDTNRLYARPGDRDELRRILEQNGEVTGFETRFKKQSGEIIWVMLSAKVVRDDSGNLSHYQGFVIDITARRRANELELANTRLRELDALKSALMSTASHDLRSPMTAILGFSELIKLDFSKHFFPLSTGNASLEERAGKIMDRLGVIAREGQRLIRLVNDFLDISKFESGCTEWHDRTVVMTEVIEQAVKVIGGQSPENPLVDFKVISGPDIPPVLCDPDRIMQVMVNLLSNAAKFTRAGDIIVRLQTVPGNQIEIRVEDAGPGIPEEEKEKIFNKFYQIGSGQAYVGKSPKGTGLGLAICKQIVEHYGGKIWVESEPGCGSTFILRLPVDNSGDR